MSVSLDALTPLEAAPATGDLLVLVDISDPTQGAAGTVKNMTVANLFTAPAITGTATVVNIAATGTIRAGAASSIGFTGRTIVTAPSDGVLDVFHADGSTVGTLTANVQVNGGTVAFAEGAVRSWSMQATGGNLVIASGDAGGIVSIGSASIGLPPAAITGSLSVSTTTTLSGKVTVGASAAANLVVAAGGGALLTTATAGFLFLSSCPGIPTGVPASINSGTVPTVYDTVDNKIWFYNGSWRGVTVS